MITVEVYKYQDKPHLTYASPLLRETGSEIVLIGEWGRPLKHFTRGQDFKIENQSIEFFWTDRWYTVSAACDREGKIYAYYCNINLPARREGDRLTYIDLDLDLWVNPDLTWRILDEDEFEEHAVKYGYPPEIIAGARQALQELIAVVEARAYPFDGTIQGMCKERYQVA